MSTSPASASEIQTEGLVKTFGPRTVVNGVSLRFSAGEVVGLLGPNGAGKTTTFYMVVGLIPATAGRVKLDGTDITKLRMHQRARHGIGYLPQEASVFRKLRSRTMSSPSSKPAISMKPRARSASSRSWASCASRTCARAWDWRCRAASAGASK
jgi:ABC-type branched-subunit amino acid transport system ATPase component